MTQLSDDPSQKMNSSIIHLPDGQTFTVQPVFAGLFFKSHELNKHHQSVFPIGWTIVIHTQDDGDDGDDGDAMALDQPASNLEPSAISRSHPHIHSFTKPTLQSDSLYISSISNPSSADYKAPASPTRQIAMMLWVTLYWYFHQPAPPSAILPPTKHSRHTAPDGRPRGEWRVHIRRDGVLRGRNLIPKLERMGLIASMPSAVGCASAAPSPDDHDNNNTGATSDEWAHMYVSRRMFWQLPGRLFLFTLQPNRGGGGGTASSHPGSPVSSRPASPAARHLESGNSTSSPPPPQQQQQQQQHDAGGRSQSPSQNQPRSPAFHLTGDVAAPLPPQTLLSSPSPSSSSFPIGPYFSSSHLPTYYPPPPLQYTFSNNTRHPLRPKPPRQGEVFYTRFVPSVGKYLSFRVASSSPKPVPYFGPVSSPSPSSSSQQQAAEEHKNGSIDSSSNLHLTTLCDVVLVQMWLSKPRVAKFWGGYVANFLTNALASPHSFPVIGMWDGVPFGYFEIYWVKEDILGRYVHAEDFDRGIHVFIGEEWARGKVQSWVSSLCHWIFCADYRTNSVCIEPRVDNERFIQHLKDGGFVGEKEITFPHKQSWFGRLRRENWEGPSL